MASPLVETKLHVPGLRRDLVARPRLTDLLSRGADSRLTLVSAPAGFGKTTLLAGWMASEAARQRSVAWLSLEEGERRPTSFWPYLVTSLQGAAPGVGAGVLPLLQSGRSPVEHALATVLNELGSLTDDLDLVLDDYHLAEGPEVNAGMTFFLEHLPAQVHLVISTRSDPALPLARMRARGELVEIRAADLRFTADEATAYLNEVAGLALAASDVVALEGRTEGWVAALQLAALSLQGREDVSGFIAGFAGDDRYVVDYLVEEVLSRQPEPVRRFLLQTSVLDRLCGPLCDAVTGGSGGKAMLEGLDRANLFVVPLDDTRRWYRYHHLFSDVLQTHLLDERPDEVVGLHRRASQWYDDAGEPLPAVRHALAAGEVERAASLVELAIPDLRRARQEATIRGWVDDLPDEVVRARPVLAVGLVGGLMASSEFEDVEARLDHVERLLASGRDEAPGSSARMVVVDHDELARLPGAIAMYRAALALVAGDLAETVRHADRAIEQAAEEDHLIRAGASALSGLASWATGDLEAAHRAYSASVVGLDRAGHVSDVLGCSITLADLAITQGRLGGAQRTYEDALRLASRQAGPVVRGVADMHVGLSQIAFERGDLHAARQSLQQAREIGEGAGLPQHPHRWRVAAARLREADGDLVGARDLLDEAERVYVGDFSPNVRPVSALRARLMLAQDDLGGALAWASQRGLSPEDDLSYLRECEHITLARILLARSTAEGSEPVLRDASRLLERLLAAAEEGGRTGSAIEILVLQALADQARDDLAGAEARLERALSLGEQEGYVWVFVGEGPALGSLLRRVAKRRSGWGYVRRLLVDAGQGGPVPAVRSRPASQGLVEPLSDRELDVLRLLGSDLDGPAIARELTVSLNTLRTHTKHIYAKLGVNSRRAAVRRAAALDLLSRSADR